MKQVLDFITAAAPFIVCGLMIAIIAVAFAVSKVDKESTEMKESKRRSNSYFTVGLLWYACTLISFLGTDSSSYVTYLCLGSMFLCLGAAELNKQKKEVQEDNEKEQ